MVRTPKAGRNDLCPCGSGKKFKRCHQTKQRSTRASMTMAIIVAVVLAGALIAGIASYNDDSSSIATPGRTWSPEHGHYH